MNKTKLTLGTALVSASLAFGGAAAAATLNIEGGVAGNIPETNQTNEILNDLGVAIPLGGFFGSTITLDEGSAIRVEFIGFEAGNENAFVFNGAELFNSEDTAGNISLPSVNGIATADVASAAGILDFLFSTSGEGGMEAVNGSNPVNINGSGTAVNFFASFGPGQEGATSGSGPLWLFFDDDGKNDDDNHDDFVVRISAVPLPAAALPFLTALGGLGFVARRRAKKKAA